MPFTPFHGGPGLLLKSLLPGSFSLSTFVATQVAIDCETAYHLLRSDYPLHRFLHTLVGSTLTGCAVAALVVAFARWPATRRSLAGSLSRGEVSLSAALLAGVLGGSSHSLLDSVVHADVQPLWPLSASSPLHGVLGWNAIELGCVLTGLLGAVLYARYRSSPRPAG